MSCQQLVSDIRDGLGFSGFTSAHLVQNKLSVNVTRL
ncbi:putative transmembrane protein, partial [Chlamydia psittaci 84-8471/1]